jgi:hypothetical protein
MSGATTVRHRSGISAATLRRGLAACFLGLAAAGCTDGSPFELVPVAGKVTYDDGSLIPAESIMIKFSPQAAAIDPKTHPRPGIAQVDVSDGTFEFATTHKHADGLVAGTHKVLVIAYGKDRKAVAVVPKEYEHPATTPIEIDTSDAPLEIKVPKPKGRALAAQR